MKILLSIFTVLGVAIFANAQGLNTGGYGMAGCGLGALAFKDQPGKIQILSATLNNIVSPQTFAITSGTSNCTEDANSMAANYIKVNHEALKNDVARGQGETLVGLSAIYKCESAAALGKTLQTSFGEVFTSNKPEETALNIRSIMKKNNVACAVLS